MTAAPTSLRVVLSRYALIWLSLSACSSAQPKHDAPSDAGSAGTAGSQTARNVSTGPQRTAEGGRAAAGSGVSKPASAGGGAAAAASGSGGAGSGGAISSASVPKAGSAGVNNTAGAQAEPDSGMPPEPSECGRCTAYDAPKQSGKVEPSEVSALSGVAVSRTHKDIVYAHNDHDRPVVYALDTQGRLHAQVTLDGAQTNDIEDIALGKCDAQTCVYLADVGDNAATRGEYSIVRFVEPEVPSAPGVAALQPTFKQLKFRYDDGSHNAESLMVAPDGTLYVITKLAPGSGGNVEATGPSSVYRIASDAFHQTAVATAQKVTTLSVPQRGEPALSAAAAHPCGLGFLVRTYDRVYEFLVPPGAAFEAAFTATPMVVAMPDEPQSEGIDYLADGRGFVTSGEGAGAPILITQCAP